VVGERAGAGAAQKGAGAHGRATWVVSMVSARTWVSGDYRGRWS
jgi:hypothetical protein